LGEHELLLGFNYRNGSFWQVYNLERDEQTFFIEQPDIIQEALFVDVATTQSFSFVGMKRQVSGGKARTAVYTISYRTQTISEIYLDFAGEYTLADRRTIVFCRKDKQSLRFQSLRAISKDNYYLHLMKSIKVLDRYGSAIATVCTNLLSAEL